MIVLPYFTLYGSLQCFSSLQCFLLELFPNHASKSHNGQIEIVKMLDFIRFLTVVTDFILNQSEVRQCRELHELETVERVC